MRYTKVRFFFFLYNSDNNNNICFLHHHSPFPIVIFIYFYSTYMFSFFFKINFQHDRVFVFDGGDCFSVYQRQRRSTCTCWSLTSSCFVDIYYSLHRDLSDGWSVYSRTHCWPFRNHCLSLTLAMN